MNPGPELDKAVCEIVGIKPRCVDDDDVGFGFYYATPRVSTDLGECEPVLEWLYQHTINLQYNFSEDRFVCDDYEFPGGQSLQHAACLAVLAIHEERKK